jgi:hypothetical protein
MGPDADRHAKLLIHPAVEGLAGVGVLVNGRFAPEAVRRHSERFRKRLIVNSGHAKPA